MSHPVNQHMLFQYVARQWLYMGSFMGQQCGAHVMPMFGKTVAYHRQFHRPTNVNPKQYQWVAKQWFYMGNFMGRPAWNHVIPICGKTVSLHGQFHDSINVNPVLSIVWETVAFHAQFHGSTRVNPVKYQCGARQWFVWTVSWNDQCKPHVIPMCGKTMDLQGQFNGPTHVNTM